MTLSLEKVKSKLYKFNKYYREDYFNVIGFSANNQRKIIIENKYGLICIYFESIMKDINPGHRGAIYPVEYLKNQLSELNDCYKNGLFTIAEEGIVGQYVYIDTKYGKCKMRRAALIVNFCPNISSALDKNDYFKNQAKEIHGDKYDYSMVEYKGCYDRVLLNCIEHGEFTTVPYSHIHCNIGCPMCGKIISRNKNTENAPGWTLSGWIKAAQKSNWFHSYKIYVFKLYDGKEEFYKIGRTFKKIYLRACHIPYKWETVLQIESDDPSYIFNLENVLKNSHKEFKYVPHIHFGGMYECFSEINMDLINELCKRSQETN